MESKTQSPRRLPLELALPKNILQEWHPTKNGNLKPENLNPGTKQKFWWKCPKGHEWNSQFKDRVRKGTSCPYCRNKKVGADNNLAILNPMLAMEFHPTRNAPLTPSSVTPGSNKKVWWQCNRGHEWRTSVYTRNKRGDKCPYCAGKRATFDKNLKISEPSLAAEWHPTKNGEEGPENFTPQSHRMVWWLCKKGHVWRARIQSRFLGRGCKQCSGRIATKERNLATELPELATQWNREKNDKNPEDFTPSSNQKVWWRCSKSLHSWKESIYKRKIYPDCPYCNHTRPSPEFNLTTVAPDIAKEWHTFKNNFRPEDVLPGSNKKIWWRCKLNPAHEWVAVVYSRVAGRGCKWCSPKTSRIEIRVYTELLAIFPDARWQERLNGSEADIYIPSLRLAIEVDGRWSHENSTERENRKSTKFQSMDIRLIRLRDSRLERIPGIVVTFFPGEDEFEIMARVVKTIISLDDIPNEAKLKAQTYISSDKLNGIKEFQRLISYFPGPPPEKSLEVFPDIAKEWDTERNGGMPARAVSPGSGRLAWWKCDKDHTYQMRVGDKIRNRVGCPKCSKRKPSDTYNLAVLFPEKAAEWSYEKNNERRPEQEMPGSSHKRWWKCPRGHENYLQKVYKRTGPQAQGCPICGKYRTNFKTKNI